MRLKVFLVDLAALLPGMIAIIILSFVALCTTAGSNVESARAVLHYLMLANVLSPLGAGLLGGVIFVCLLERSRARHAYYVSTAILALATVVGMAVPGGTDGFHAALSGFIGFIAPIAIYCFGLVLPEMIAGIRSSRAGVGDH